jgi:hypothetical protein
MHKLHNGFAISDQPRRLIPRGVPPISADEAVDAAMLIIFNLPVGLRRALGPGFFLARPAQSR